MIKKKSDLFIEDGNLRNGKGNVKREHIIKGDEFKGKGKLFAKITIPKGNSIGMHDHTEDFEVYYILRGTGQVLDNGDLIQVNEGDVIYTADGNEHYIENIGNEDLELIALVLYE
ncbi:cupin domain-containing protein [Romboutsia sp. Marseille-P6047]|uniref:cupin domain-containing protein n=1 Tax=Romboutsia sp. Marseille-P6047 TaxID=2161817 RepID=UPI0008214D87|nr:cupin domain-containing protein [Romboutsia sp. Marseille-P6047]SCH41022.1 Thermophilic glucose-6-phosphate isomerase and related metalloenzymes [uncultured Clostridium sp.]